MQKLCDVVVEVKKATKSHGRKKGKSKSKTVICPLLSSFASRAAHEPKLSKLVAMNMNVDDIELVETSLDMDNPPFAGPVHNSIDSGGSYNEYCVVRIRDDGSGAMAVSTTPVHGEAVGLRDSRNIKGWSKPIIDAISSEYLGNHDCLGVSNIEQQSLGGPTRGDDGSPEFIWIQWCVWFPDQDSSAWSDVRLVNFCMVLCLPTADEAGTLITNFVGPRDLVDHISTVCTEQVTNIHPLGIKSLQIWGIYPNSNQASTAILIGGREEKAAPEESVEIGGHEGAGEDKATANFFASIQTMVFEEIYAEDEVVEKRKQRLKNRSRLEATRAQGKIKQQQKLCRTFTQQYESSVQLIIWMSTRDIINRLDSTRGVTDQFMRIGTVIGALACIIAPLSLLVGIFGMNLEEITGDAANIALYDFFKIGLPVVILMGICGAVFATWVLDSRSN
ncbi:hypothetical protein V498_07584 [Pseudogymnoascus sp. VKM F-4517 (FW-2822)]|nr:hypothetical protein V498_07584 [Pseudogymnoascus sp. VKM F-4517 (FW-2822)]